MMKLYTQRLAVIIAVIALSGTAMAQTITFTGAKSSFWGTPGNWDSGVVPNGNDANATIVIAPTAVGTDSSAIITGTVTLSGVKIIVHPGYKLIIGNGSGNGANKGILTLDNASSISIQSDGTKTGQVESNSSGNSNNVITIGGVVKFQGGLTYNTNPGSGPGDVFGPALADASTSSGVNGFTVAALPVTLSGFVANLASGGKVAINWNTQQEINTDHFDIQRSSDGLNWQPLSTIKAAGSLSTPKSYSCTDSTLRKREFNLYRLKTVDVDGNFSAFSSIVNVRLSLVGKVSVFPNPAASLLNLSLAEVPVSDWTVSLINNSGQILLKKKFSKDQTTVSLPVINCPTGNYTVEITDGAGSQSVKLMIAHQ